MNIFRYSNELTAHWLQKCWNIEIPVACWLHNFPRCWTLSIIFGRFGRKFHASGCVVFSGWLTLGVKIATRDSTRADWIFILLLRRPPVDGGMNIKTHLGHGRLLTDGNFKNAATPSSQIWNFCGLKKDNF